MAATGYQIGVTPANMVDLDSLDLPDPLWGPLSDWQPFSGTKVRGDGLVVGTGRVQFSWRFNELTLSEVGSLLYFITTAGVAQASKVVYVRTRIAESQMAARVFQSYQATMIWPFEPKDMRYDVNELYQNVTIRFIQATEI